jgi:hypothetical protein
MADINELTREDLVRVVQRDRYVKGEMASRIAALVQENLDLVAIVHELQQDLADVRQSEAMLFAANTADVQANGDVVEQASLFTQD